MNLTRQRNMAHFQYVIIGTGQATGALLGRLIPTGRKIAVIEQHKVGGSCVNYGCTPTKTLVATAKAIHTARRGDFFGFDTGHLSIDFGKVRQRMDEIRNGSTQGLEKWMNNTSNVTLYKGRGRFNEDKSITVGDHTITGDQIFINTGTRAATPAVNGLEEVPWLDNERLLSLEKLPRHLLIIGGGYIAMEFGQIFKRFGCDVTILQRNEQIMSHEDEDVANSIQQILEEEGVRIICNAGLTEVCGSDGDISVHLERGDTIAGSHILFAIGRAPNSDTLDPDAIGLNRNEQGFIVVDDHCRTNVEGIYAVGDVNGQGAFTHTSVNDAEIVLDDLFDGDRQISHRIPIYALFTDPPLGRTGLSEKEALAGGKRVLKAVRPMSKINRAREMGETKGFAKLLVDADTDLILGASILGPGADEIINMFAVLIHQKIPCKDYRKVVHVHPTVSELMPWILDGLEPVSG